MNIRLKQIKNYPIYHIDFDTRYELTMTMLRFQEYYESPYFADKVFDLEEYIQWYVGMYGDFTYYKDWSGFNMPSRILWEVELFFGDLSKKEKFLLDFIKNNIKQHMFYLIGTFGNKQNVLNHEIAHGFFYCDKVYRDTALDIIEKYNTNYFKEWLQREGYAEKVWLDEIQAYALTGFEDNFYLTQEEKLLSQELKNKLGHYLEI